MKYHTRVNHLQTSFQCQLFEIHLKSQLSSFEWLKYRSYVLIVVKLIVI